MTPTARRVVAAALCAGGGAVAGAATWVLGSERTPAERAAAAVLLVLAAAPVVAAAVVPEEAQLRGRLRVAGATFVHGWLAGAVAGLVAGAGLSATTAALVPAGVAALAAGLAMALTGRGVQQATALFAAAALALAPAASVFVADPWIEWHGGDAAASPGRAQTAVSLSPVAAVASFDGGVGVDWLRQRMMYDGPARGVPGLSLIGQYYAVREPPALAWGLAAGLLGLSAACAPRRLRPCSPGSSSPSPSA